MWTLKIRMAAFAPSKEKKKKTKLKVKAGKLTLSKGRKALAKLKVKAGMLTSLSDLLQCSHDDI